MATLREGETAGLDAPGLRAAVMDVPQGHVAAERGGVAAGGVHGGFSLRSLRTFSSFNVASFRWFYGSMIGQMAAMQVEMVARGVLIYDITESGTILGVMALAQSLPMLFASLWGGVAADRIPKKYLMVVGMGSNGLVALAIAIAITLGFVTESNPALAVWILIIAGLFKGTVQGMIMPARQSIIPELVGREQIMNAMALNNLGMNVLRFIAPALAGFAIDWWGFESVYYLMTALFIGATFCALRLPKTAPVTTRPQTRALSDLAGGFRYARRDKTIGLILGFTLFVVLCSMPYMMLLPIFTKDILHQGASGLGILVSVSAIGAIVCSLVLASLPNKYRGLMLIASSFVLGGALIVFAFSTLWELSLIAIIFVGMGQTGRMTLAGTLLQHYVEDEYRGRVMAMYMMEFGLTSLAVFVAGVLSDSIGVQWAVGGLAMILMVVTAIVFMFSPKLRALQ
jgi:MFS family permease